MPEILEIEQYRRQADAVVGRQVTSVLAPDDWYLKRGTTAASVARALRNVTITGTRRRGKLLLLDTTGPVLGLRFGMTGRLLVDRPARIDELAYGPARDNDSWHRFVLRFRGGGRLTVSDARRLGGVELDPNEEALGPDALTVTPRQVEAAVRTSTAPIKARLMDQSVIAGLGNLLTDEILWRASIDPSRPSSSLPQTEVRRLHRTIRTTLPQLLDRGGSHMGDLQDARVRGGRCPRDGAELLRRTIGGRTTYSCPVHQR